MLSRLAPLLFILSGLAGLVLQLAWFRLLSQSLGGTLAAATADLTAFMGGLALGSWWFSRPGSRIQRDPLRGYGLLEIGAGVAALLTLPLLEGLDRVYGSLAGVIGEQPGLLLALKLMLAMLCLGPATTFMGGTLPALCQALARRRATAGGDTGGLYALNVGGAVLGTLLALFWLLPDIGLSGSVAFAGCLDLVVGAVVLGLAAVERRRGRSPELGAEVGAPVAEPQAAPAPPDPDTDLARALPALLFVVGLAGIAYEILWTRILAFYFGSGAQAFGVVLAVVLIGFAGGGFLGGHLADRLKRPVLVFVLAQVLIAAGVAVQVWRFPGLPDFLYGMALQAKGPIHHSGLILLLLLGAVQLILPVSLAMGAAFPSAVRAAVRSDGSSGPLVGRLAAANSFGTIPGAVLAAWVFVPAFGVQGALFFTAGISLLVGLVAVVLSRPRGARIPVAIAGALVIAGLAVLATRVEPQRALSGSGVFADDGGGRNLIFLDESAHGTVSLSKMEDSRGTWLSLSVDGVNVAGTSPPLLACQSLQGHLPLLLHPDPRRVLHVGFGSGGTAAAVATHGSVEHLDVAEINPAIPRVSRERMQAINEGVLDDPRLQVHFADGRNYLLATTDRFDCILSDSIHPRYRGNANLYTVDYFRLCRARLAPGGLVSTWLPIYSLSKDSLRSIVASMREVFPQTSVWYLNSTVNEFVIVVGRTAETPIDAQRIAAAMREPSVAASLARVGVTSPAHVLDYLIAEGTDLDSLVGDVPLHYDDLPWVEFASASVMDRDASWRENLRLCVAARVSALPRLSGVNDALQTELQRFEAATTVALQGHLLFLARDFDAAGARFRRARAMNPADPEPWEWFGPPAWVAGLVGKPVRSAEPVPAQAPSGEPVPAQAPSGEPVPAQAPSAEPIAPPPGPTPEEP